MYTDESQTLLRAGAIVFYPVHVRFANFYQGFVRKGIACDQIFTAYVLERFNSQQDKDVTEWQVDQKINLISCEEFLRALHQSVELSLEPVSAVVLKSISCKQNTRMYNAKLLNFEAFTELH